MGWLSNWKYRRKITIDQGDINESLTNFPILIYISFSSGISGQDLTSIFDELGSNRLKIAVTKDDGTTQCYVEIETWDLSNEKAWLWVKVPNISAVADTDLYIYYDSTKDDNVDYVGDPNSSPAESVWETSYKFCTHMKDDPDTSHIRDSTANNNDGTKAGANEPIEIDGKVSKAQDFDGSNDRVTVAHSPSINFEQSDSFSLCAWLKIDQLGVSHSILGKYGAGYIGYHFFVHSANNQVRTEIVGTFPNEIYVGGSSTLQTGIWYFATMTYNGSGLASGATIYLNGIAETMNTYTDSLGTDSIQHTDNLRIGQTSAAAYCDGIIDEVRISAIQYSPAWIKADYETQRDHILTYGAQEIPPKEISESSTISDLFLSCPWKLLSETIDYEDSSSRLWTILTMFPETLSLTHLRLMKFIRPFSELLDIASYSSYPPVVSLLIQIIKTLTNTLGLSDVKATYLPIGAEEFEVKIYRANTELEVDNLELLKVEIRKLINTEVGDAYILFDNEPKKDYKEGDAIEIYWASKGLYRKIFSGEIDEANKIGKSEDEDEKIELKARSWGKILLEKKITRSFPTVTDIDTIITTILNEQGVVITGEPMPSERKINISSVYNYTGTRTLDFVGEPLWDCLRKVAEVTSSDFYVAQDKHLYFFPRNSRASNKILYGNSAGNTTNLDNIDSYEYENRNDMICNKVYAYGQQNKPYPLDLDSEWTEDLNHWSEIAGTTMALESSVLKAGVKSILAKRTGDSGDSILGLRCDFSPLSFNLTTKQGYKKLKFAHRFYNETGASFKDLVVFLQDAYGHGVQYKYKQYPIVDSGVSATHNVNFSEVDLPLGPEHEISGEWEPAVTQTWITYATFYVGATLPVVSFDKVVNNTPRETIGIDPYLDVNDIGNVVGMGPGGALGYFHFNTLDYSWTSNTVTILGSTISAWAKKGFVRGAETNYKLYTNGTLKTTDTWYEYNYDFTEHILSPFSSYLNNIYNIDNAWLRLDVSGDPEENKWTWVTYAEIRTSGYYVTTGEVTLSFVAGTFDWTSVSKVLFLWKVYRDAATEVRAYIDWLHFDEGKWYGEYSTGAGDKFLEIFDETMFSDTAASRRAREYVETYKDSIPTYTNVLLDYVGKESLEPGMCIAFCVPENEITGTITIGTPPDTFDVATYATISVRIKEIRYTYEEGDFDIYIDAAKVG